jgi:hypothetical protein
MTNIYISWGSLLLPIASYFLAKKMYPKHLCTIMGISFGLVVSPSGLGLYYAGYMIPVVGVILIVFFAFISAPHGAAGLGIAEYFHLVRNGSNGLNLWVELVSGIIWGSFYGIIGYLIDKLRRREKPQQLHRGDRA